jgi:hypothetical protein
VTSSLALLCLALVWVGFLGPWVVNRPRASRPASATSPLDVRWDRPVLLCHTVGVVGGIGLLLLLVPGSAITDWSYVGPIVLVVLAFAAVVLPRWRAVRVLTVDDEGFMTGRTRWDWEQVAGACFLAENGALHLVAPADSRTTSTRPVRSAQIGYPILATVPIGSIVPEDRAALLLMLDARSVARLPVRKGALGRLVRLLQKSGPEI